MWRRRPFSALSLVALSVSMASCVPRQTGYTPPSIGPSRGSAQAVPVNPLRRELTGAQARVRDLEQQLAERDREIAAVQQQINTAKAQGGGPSAAAPPVAQPADEPTEPPSEANDASASEPPPPSPPRPEPVAAAPPPAPPPAPAPAAANAADEQLASAQRQIAKLERQLAGEVERRKAVENEMERLLQETSAGPFDKSTASVEKHLREQLDGARREIADLRTSLVTERRERQELEKRYGALQAQLRATASAPAAGGNEEVEALKERQRRVLASIQQDLEASRAREAEMRKTLETAQGSDGVSLADAVSNLRSENSALQMRLDEEHRQNRDLNSKLQLATRVTDLIFKMQSGGGAMPVAAPNGARP